MYLWELIFQINSIYSSRMNIYNYILNSNRTVFNTQTLSGFDKPDIENLSKSLSYYVKKGLILNPRRGVYAKPNYSKEEMACSIFRPSYISLEYVLSRAGVTFQYSEDITSVCYLSRTIEIDGNSYSYRKINPMILFNQDGIIQNDNIAIATPERAFLDMIYLSGGQVYFDNLTPLNKNVIDKLLLSIYSSKKMFERTKQIIG